jgi:hypothetical protein
VTNPNAGGAPEAMAIPMDKGSATRKTTIEARKSLTTMLRKFDPLFVFVFVFIFDSLTELRRSIIPSENHPQSHTKSHEYEITP